MGISGKYLMELRELLDAINLGELYLEEFVPLKEEGGGIIRFEKQFNWF